MSDDQGAKGRQIKMVEVPRHDATVAIGDLLNPLTRTAGHLRRQHGRQIPAEAEPLLDRFTELVRELEHVSARLNQIDGGLLASKAEPPPEDR